MKNPILVINAGSSSLKFSVFAGAPEGSLSAGRHGLVEGIGMIARLSVTDGRVVSL